MFFCFEFIDLLLNFGNLKCVYGKINRLFIYLVIWLSNFLFVDRIKIWKDKIIMGEIEILIFEK